MIGSTYLVATFVMEAYEIAALRCGLMLLFMAMTAWVLPHPTAWNISPPRARLTLLFLAAIPFAVALASLATRHRTRLVTGCSLAAVVALSALLVARAERPGHWLPYRRITLLTFGFALLIPATSLISGVLVPKDVDIAMRSLDAVAAIFKGENFYSLLMDQQAISVTDARFGGYKYGPLLAYFYAPFIGTFGTSGILVGNLLAYGLVLALTVGLGTRLGASFRPVVLFFIASTVLAAMPLMYLGNDFWALGPVLATFLIWPGSPLIVGILLGASLATKLLPAVVAIPLLCPRVLRQWPYYALGLAIGLLPCLVYLAWDPWAFLYNYLLFSFYRPPHFASWTALLPEWGRVATKLVAAATWLGLAAATILRDWDMRQRLLAYVFSILTLLFAAQIASEFYWVWWMPAFIAIACIPPGEQAAARQSVSART